MVGVGRPSFSKVWKGGRIVFSILGNLCSYSLLDRAAVAGKINIPDLAGLFPAHATRPVSLAFQSDRARLLDFVIVDGCFARDIRHDHDIVGNGSIQGRHEPHAGLTEGCAALGIQKPDFPQARCAAARQTQQEQAADGKLGEHVGCPRYFPTAQCMALSRSVW